MDSLDRYKLPPRYFSNESMNVEQQFEWITQKEYNDPHWAQTEADIRRLAVELQHKLNKHGSSEIVSVSVPRYDEDGYAGIRYERVQFMLTRLGATEELLLIEEQLRRAMRAK